MRDEERRGEESSAAGERSDFKWAGLREVRFINRPAQDLLLGLYFHSSNGSGVLIL